MLVAFLAFGFFALPAFAVDSPSGLSATWNGGNSVQVRWNSVGGASIYYVFRSTYDGGYQQVGSSMTTGFSDSVPSTGITYYYRVVASDGTATGELSGTSTVTTSIIVTVDLMGGILDVPKTTMLSPNEKFANPGVPTREGYLFRGWTTDKAGEELYHFEKDVETGFTLYAKWDKVHTVVFQYQGYGEDNNFLVGHGNLIDPPLDPENRADYQFLGWFDGETEWAFSTMAMPDRDLVLTAQWLDERVRDYIVTFDFADEKDTREVKIVRNGNLVARPDDPSREGYRFEGWYHERELWNFDQDVMPNRNLLLKASWTADVAAATAGNKTGFDSQITSQTGNPFLDISNGNVPGGGFNYSGYWSVINLLFTFFSVISAVVVAARLFTKRWSQRGFRSRRIILFGQFAVMVGFLMLVLIIREDFTQPALLVTRGTIVTGILFLLQALFLFLYFGKGMERSEWMDYLKPKGFHADFRNREVAVAEPLPAEK